MGAFKLGRMQTPCEVVLPMLASQRYWGRAQTPGAGRGVRRSALGCVWGLNG